MSFYDMFCVLLLASMATSKAAASAYFADFSAFNHELDRQPTCVAIPSNMTLCNNIGYTKMRLPNLLKHDTIQEASQQASYWQGLSQVRCAEDSQLFLCSLFAPVCLERPIFPCRSLCQKVKAGCESTLKARGFPWPPMLHCDNFPLDNDMCITSQAEAKRDQEEDEDDGEAVEDGSPCTAKPCNQPSSYENILQNYCQADFVVKMKFRDVRRRNIYGKKVNTVFKTWRGTPSELRRLRRPSLKLEAEEECCGRWARGQPRRQKYLVMGKNKDGSLVPTLILPWTRDKDMRRAKRMFKQIDCSKNSQNQKMIDAKDLDSRGRRSQKKNKSKRQHRRRGRNRETNHKIRHHHGEE